MSYTNKSWGEIFLVGFITVIAVVGICAIACIPTYFFVELVDA